MIPSFGRWHHGEQLAEDYLISLTDRWLLSWEALYHLLEDEEHASSLPLIGIPEVLPLRASMSSRGALSDKDFRVWIAEWTTLPSRQTIRFSRTGAIFTHENQQHLLSRENWALLQATEQLSIQQTQAPAKPLTSWDGPQFANARNRPLQNLMII